MPYLFALIMLLAISPAAAQEQPDYLRYPSVPKFTVQTPDSNLHVFDGNPKNKKTIIFIFSTDCHYCKQEIDSLTANMNTFGDVRIVMAAFEPLEAVRNFANSYNLHKYPNIIIGRDVNYFFMPFYDVTQVPFIALYSERGKLVKTFRSSASITTLAAAFAEHRDQ